MPAPHTEPALTVYYDGSCPLCRREIAHYRRLAPREPLAWVDVSAPEAALGAGLSAAEAMARFHVRTPDGTLLGGGAAFARLWLAMPGWHWLGRLCSNRPMTVLLEAAYRTFLPVRPWLQRRLGGAHQPSDCTCR